MCQHTTSRVSFWFSDSVWPVCIFRTSKVQTRRAKLQMFYCNVNILYIVVQAKDKINKHMYEQHLFSKRYMLHSEGKRGSGEILKILD